MERTTEVHTQLMNVSEISMRVAELVTALNQRLQPVSRSGPPSSQNDKLSAVPSLCTVAEQIRCVTDTLDRCKNMLEMTLELLEV